MQSVASPAEEVRGQSSYYISPHRGLNIPSLPYRVKLRALRNTSFVKYRALAGVESQLQIVPQLMISWWRSRSTYSFSSHDKKSRSGWDIRKDPVAPTGISTFPSPLCCHTALHLRRYRYAHGLWNIATTKPAELNDDFKRVELKGFLGHLDGIIIPKPMPPSESSILTERKHGQGNSSFDPKADGAFFQKRVVFSSPRRRP